MEIIIRMEEKENPTVGAALYEMAEDYWVKTYLPQLIQKAKEGHSCGTLSINIPASAAEVVETAFAKLGIKVSTSGGHYNSKCEYCYEKIVFSWGS